MQIFRITDDKITKMELKEKIYKIVAKIPAGRVMTYGQIARIVGTSPRVVGNFLHQNPDPQKIPCHRVVDARREVAKNFAFGGAAAQREKLEEEGVIFVGDRISIP